MRIAHLTTVDMSLALLLGTELEEDLNAGHTVFGISAEGPYVEQVQALGVTHVPIKHLTRAWSLRNDVRAFVELVRTLRKLRLDVIHTHTPKAGVMGRIAGRLAGVPVVVNTCHGLWARPDDPLVKRLVVYGIEGFAIRFSDYELFQNAQDARTLRRFLRKGRWEVVGNGIDLDRFQPDPEGRTRLRAEWGFSDDELVVGVVGRRVREKGLAEFAEAAHLLGDRARFVWIGPEDDTDAAATVPFQDSIQFVPERRDMPAVYSALDLFVLPSYREGFSRAAMEAAACGNPMILSDIRGCWEIGTDHEHLRLVPPKNARALSEVIAEVLEDAQLRKRLGDAAAHRAHSEFDQREVAARSLTAYREVMGRKRPRETHSVDRVRVLHVLPHDQGRGAQVYAGQLRDALRDDPAQAHKIVILFESEDAAARADMKLGVKPGALRRGGLDPRALVRLRRMIRRGGVSLVVGHGGEALKYVIPAAGSASTIYYKVGLSSSEIERPLHMRLYRWLSNKADRVVAVSSAVAQQVADDFRVPKDRISVIPNGRDSDRYRTLHPDESAVSPPRMIFVGALEDGKRPDLFLDVVEELNKQGLKFQAAVVGDGPLRTRLEGRAAALNVELMGVREDVPELLRESAVLVMTSKRDTEGMPGVLIEAGLSGIPVVSTEAAGVRDVIDDGETGWIISDDDVDRLVDRVEVLLQEPHVRVRMGALARELMLCRFDLEVTIASWREKISELADAGNIQRDIPHDR